MKNKNGKRKVKHRTRSSNRTSKTYTVDESLQERKKSRFPWIMISMALSIVILGAVIFGIMYGQMAQWENESAQVVYANFIDRNYYPLAQTMEACGFQAESNDAYKYRKSMQSQVLTLTFDFNLETCEKNLYTFDLSGNWMMYEGNAFVSKSLLEDITNHILFLQDDLTIHAKKVVFAPHDWATVFRPLIAHAGGALRTETANHTYTNGLKALVQNYDLGHRIFEFDLQSTSDGGVAAVHTGIVAGDENGIFMTTKEWLSYRGMGNIGVTTIGDILDQMMINADMFIVTDTKGPESIIFERILAEAETRDPALMDRIIPQIYTREMYTSIMTVYDFPSIIFTTYANEETPRDVIDFSVKKDNIRVVTVSYYEGSYITDYVSLAKDTGLLLYLHTLNGYDDITTFRGDGFHGLYTDYLLPRDFDIYASTVVIGG